MKEFTFLNLPCDSRNILYVGNNKTLKTCIDKKLQNSISNLVVAENGLIGIDYFMECQPEIVITDLDMPGMSGPTFISHVRKLNKNVLVVINAATGKDKAGDSPFQCS